MILALVISTDVLATNGNGLKPGDINECGMITQNGTYNLQTNLTANATFDIEDETLNACFMIQGAENVTFNLNGYNITSNQSLDEVQFGILSMGSYNITIEGHDAHIKNFNHPGPDGNISVGIGFGEVNIGSSNNISFFNNTVGVMTDGSHDINITNNSYRNNFIDIARKEGEEAVLTLQHEVFGSSVSLEVFDSGVVENVTFLDEWNISVPHNEEGDNSTVIVPSDTVMTSEDGFDDFDLDNLTEGLGANGTVEGDITNIDSVSEVLEFGMPDMGLNFSNNISINLSVSGCATDDLDIYRSVDGVEWTQEGLANKTCEVVDDVCSFETDKASYFATGDREMVLTIDVDGNGTAEPETGQHGYPEGEELQVNTTPDEGWYFSHWEGDYPDGDSEEANITVTMDQNKELTANFEEYRNLTLIKEPEEGGTVTIDPDEEYEKGVEVSLTAESNLGYEFKEWEGDVPEGKEHEKQITITMDDDKEIIANFEIIIYELTIDSTGGGHVTEPGQGTFPYQEGEEVEIRAEPYDNFHRFVGWTGDVENVLEPEDAITTVEMFGDYSITAEFEEKDEFYGYVFNQSGEPLENVNITVLAGDFPEGEVNETIEGKSDGDGFFNITDIPPEEDGHYYRIFMNKWDEDILRYTSKINLTEYITPHQFFAISGKDFYLSKGVKINVNTTDENHEFRYDVFDVASDKSMEHLRIDDDEKYSQNFSFYGAVDGEYLLDIDKQSTTAGFRPHITDIEDGWDEDKQELNYTMNLTESEKSVSGYVEADGVSGFDNISVVYYILNARGEGLPDFRGRFNFSENGEYDEYIEEEGFYNISIPTPVDGGEHLLFFTAYNKTEGHYGAVQTVKYEGEDIEGHNITLEKLRGSESGLDIYGENDDDDIVNTTLKKFQFINGSTGEMIEDPEDYQGEIHMNYSSYWGENSTEIGWTKILHLGDMNVEENYFELPVFGEEGMYLDMHVHGYSPRSMRLTEEHLKNDDPVNITIRNYGEHEMMSDFEDIDLWVFGGETADQPYPEHGDRILKDKGLHGVDLSNFILENLGGNMSFRMGMGDINVHYSNVDVSGSGGSPDALFSSDPDISDIGDGFDSLWKFGSTGPQVYDKVLVSMPYDTREEEVSLNITYLYDDDMEDIIWNATDGDNVTDIETNDELSHYREGYVDTIYEAYLNGTGVECDSDDEDLSDGLCYKDTESGILWAEIPHFTGVAMNTPGVPQRNLTVNIDGEGSVDVGVEENIEAGDTFTFNHSDVVELTADADGGWEFVRWEDDVDEVSDVYSADTKVTMYDDYSITAVFEEETEEEDDTDDTGTITPSPAPGPAPAPEPEVASEARSWDSISPGVVEIMEIDASEELGVRQISISVQNEANDVEITVTKQEDRPADVEVDVTGKAYRFMSIEAQNLDDENLEEATIEFDVNKSWIEENNIDREKVYLNRYVDGNWERLETNEISDTATKVVYESSTSGFSYFAVSGEEFVEEEEEPEDEEEVEDEPVDEEQPEEEEERKVWLWIALVAIVVAVAGVVFYLYSEKQE